MIFNFQNCPVKATPQEYERWIKGLQKELEQADRDLHDAKGFVSIYSVRELQRIREILGK